MNKLDLKAYGVSEMTTVEMVETDGGGLLLGLAVAALIALVVSSCDNQVTINYQKGNNNTNNQTTSRTETATDTTATKK